MALFKIDLASSKKPAIAQETISGAIRILSAAGFDDGEIKKLFLVASGQLTDREDADFEELDGFDADGEDLAEARRYEFITEFVKLGSAKALERLSKRYERVWQYETDEELNAAFGGLKEAIPHGEATQKWVRDNAPQFGLSVHDNRDTWVLSASDDDLDRERDFIFLDDWQFRTQFHWDIASVLSREFARRGDREKLDQLADLIASSSMAFPKDFEEEVAQALEQVSLYDQFKKYVYELSGQGELTRSQVTDEFCRTFGLNQTYLLDSWLDLLSAKGDGVQVYKRSNRWRVNVQ